MIEPLQIIITVGSVVAGIFIYENFVKNYKPQLHIQSLENNFRNTLTEMEKRLTKNDATLSQNMIALTNNHLKSLGNRINHINHLVNNWRCKFEDKHILDRLETIENALLGMKAELMDIKANTVVKTKETKTTKDNQATKLPTTEEILAVYDRVKSRRKTAKILGIKPWRVQKAMDTRKPKRRLWDDDKDTDNNIFP